MMPSRQNENRDPSSGAPSDRRQASARRLFEQAQQISRLHEEFLAQRQDGFRTLSRVTSQEFSPQGGLDQAGRSAPRPAGIPQPELITADQLREFAEGDILKCLSPAYAIYQGRRTPRIPRGDLLLMSRVVRIDGTVGRFDQPAEIQVEYDVPQQAWYFRPDFEPQMPYAILMEIALQPCGFLTAYLETPLQYPQEDFYFRNLDGDARISQFIDPRGKTITTRARLDKSSVSGGIIVQKFSFELTIEGRVFYSGHSIFGYFPPLSMQAQTGLESGLRQDPWLNTAPRGVVPLHKITPYESSHRLDDLDQLVIVPNGGLHNLGYAYAQRKVDPKAWFFDCHFLEDPVMPGSLGVEAMLTLLKSAAKSILRLPATAHFRLGKNRDLSWKYRGQILPSHGLIEIEIHVGGIQKSSNRHTIWADGTLWIDGARIYKVNRAELEVIDE